MNKQQNCEWTEARMDLYIDRELGDEAGAVEQHLNSCSDCADAVVYRQTLRRKVRTAADNAFVPADLAARVRTRLDARSSGWRWPHSIMAVAAMLAVVVGGITMSQRSGSHEVESEAAMLSRVDSITAPVLRVGLQDHIHCARFQKYPATAPSLAELTVQLGHDFHDLAEIVQANVPSGLKVIEAHHCTFGKRKYIHVVARQGEQLLSLVITSRGAGEAFEKDLKSVLSESGVSLYTASHANFQIAGFETGHYLAYVISNVGQAENLVSMRGMVPALSEVFRKVEI